MNLNFFFEVLIGGLLSGVMYALVALGFVLIYKASGVFNFAQGHHRPVLLHRGHGTANVGRGSQTS